MEQSQQATTRRIDSRDVGALITSQRQILFARGSEMLLGYDVIDLKGGFRQRLREMAIFAARFGSRPDKFFQCGIHAKNYAAESLSVARDLALISSSIRQT